MQHSNVVWILPTGLYVIWANFCQAWWPIGQCIQYLGPQRIILWACFPMGVLGDNFCWVHACMRLTGPQRITLLGMLTNWATGDNFVGCMQLTGQSFCTSSYFLILTLFTIAWRQWNLLKHNLLQRRNSKGGLLRIESHVQNA